MKDRVSDDGRAIVDALAAALGDEAITRTDGDRDPDPRTADHLSGRDLGRPLCWVRATDSRAVATVVRLAAAAARTVVPVGAATAYWDPLRLGGVIALDTRALTTPITIDPISRVAHAGAGVSIRAIDQAARGHGLSVAARPDAGGDTPVGALLAVGSTAGLGLGIASPIELVGGATVVSGRGEILRLGASYALSGEAYQRHGAPDALGLSAASEGRGAIVTEVGLLLHPAPAVVTLRARGRADLAALLAAARRALDDGRLESYRIELTDELSVMARTIGRAGAKEALDGARALGTAWREAGLDVADPEPEPEEARRGEDPAYAYHWAFPVGEHRARLLGGALWGVEVGTSWRAVEAVTARLGLLHRELAAHAPLQRRLALYPAPHAITVGVQVILRRDPRLESAVAQLEAALPDLLELGVVPYRRGHLWRGALARFGATNVADSLLAELDPDGVIGGSRA